MPPASRGSALSRLLLLFALVPLTDLFVLLWVGSRLGFWPTLLLISTTAFCGAWFARREGMGAWQRFQAKLATGGLPGRELTDGLIILFSGLLLLTPGLITDAAGLLGLLPPTRAWIRGRLARGATSGGMRFVSFGGGMPPGFGASGFPPGFPGGGRPGTAASGGPVHSEPRPEPPRNEDVVDVDFEEIERPRR